MQHLILVLVIGLFLTNPIFSQTTPKPPKTLETSSSSSTTKSSSYSITFDTDDKQENSSVSIKRTDATYKFTANFHESKTGSIKKLLIDKLGKSDLTVIGDTYRWVKNENGEKVFDCKLTDDALKIYVDKEFANSKIIDIMDEFGEVLKKAISGTDYKEEVNKKAERELKRAEKALADAKREVERIKRNSKNKK